MESLVIRSCAGAALRATALQGTRRQQFATAVQEQQAGGAAAWPVYGRQEASRLAQAAYALRGAHEGHNPVPPPPTETRQAHTAGLILGSRQKQAYHTTDSKAHSRVQRMQHGSKGQRKAHARERNSRRLPTL